jgi:hypothetical protein
LSKGERKSVNGALPAIAAVVLAGVACTPAYETRLSFDSSKLSADRWETLQNECYYEARKATASGTPGPVRLMEREELYILCLEAKGVKFKGKIKVPV